MARSVTSKDKDIFTKGIPVKEIGTTPSRNRARNVTKRPSNDVKRSTRQEDWFGTEDNSTYEVRKKLEMCLSQIKNDTKGKKLARKEDFQDKLKKIVTKIENRLPNGKNVHDLFFANEGSVTKMVSTYSKYGEEPEAFTKRFVIEPLLEELGYKEIAYEVKLGTNSKAVDLALIVEDARPCSLPEVILVECKLMGGKNERSKEQIKQYLKNYNKQSYFTPYMGILTDGCKWDLYVYKSDGTFGKPFSIDIQPLLRWAYLENHGKRQPFPMTAYRKFINILSMSNVKVYGDCLRYGVELLTLDDEGGKIRMNDLPADKMVVMEENSIPDDYGPLVALALRQKSKRKL